MSFNVKIGGLSRSEWSNGLATHGQTKRLGFIFAGCMTRKHKTLLEAA